jgi:hypothetical protein
VFASFVDVLGICREYIPTYVEKKMAIIHVTGPTVLLLAGVFVAWFYAPLLGLMIIGVAIIVFIAVFLMGAAVLRNDRNQHIDRGY